MNQQRTKRIAEEIKKVLSSLLLTDLKDSRIDEFASINHVELTNDLSLAKVYVSAFDEEKRESTIEGLTSAKGFIKREVSNKLQLRAMPDFEFINDDSIEKTFEFMELLDSIKEE